ncbi:MAG: hypothetical protein EBS01_04825, partial [Verrucomicrobia bacterium]|nr:hypothetical protein [Verrucomicrobiota bacterium]
MRFYAPLLRDHSSMISTVTPRFGRPHVVANFAVTWDGRISTRGRTLSNFSSPRDKRRLLEIRSEGDAVVASLETVKADTMTMGLPDRGLRAEREARGQSAFPLRVVVSGSGALDPDLRLFGETFSPVVVFSTQRMPMAVREALAGKAAVRLIDAEKVDV